ncbi:hypothetical protein SAMN03097699_0710 [Flavobacteriaceae bacterium MAR_2010_188]|nr:hypothetical protein SAMN03097699_0710 [Flavobacteriaceae bacterium MAR_2010_188]
MSRTSLYTISIAVFIFWANIISAQEETKVIDTVVYKQSYGLRVGADLGKLARSFLDEDYSGFEIIGDYRLTKKLYIAGEIGTEEKTTASDYLDVTTSGNYFKAGIDYNFYENWLDMDNLIYGGLRVGVTSFKHSVNSFTIYNTDQYYQTPVTLTDNAEISGLSALWGELLVGIKAEIFSNLYMGLNIQFKGLISEDSPNNFENLYIPGYNRTYDSGRFGFGYGYTLSYRIPLYKKAK